jgi:hypothetical protein
VTGDCCGWAKRIEPTGGERNSGRTPPQRDHRASRSLLSRDLYYLGGSGFGCVGDPGGTLGLVSGVFGGFEEGGAGTSGGEFGSDGDVGDGDEGDGDEGDSGVCCVQPVAIAQSAMAARVDLARFISALLRILECQSARSEAHFA